jgi:hypothetical protein
VKSRIHALVATVDLPDVVILSGAVSVTVGAAILASWLGWIVGGLVLILLGVLLSLHSQ